MLHNVLEKLDTPKTNKCYDILGYSIDELKDHIKKHPNWEKCKNIKWHLDHVFPIKAFIDNGIRDIKLINGLGNLQPLPETENLHKSCAYDCELFKLTYKQMT